MAVWGNAYDQGEVSRSLLVPSGVFSSFGMGEQAILRGNYMQHVPYGLLASSVHANSSAEALPRAQDHPLFYVGVYALIGFATGFTSIFSIIAQFVGGLRASRLLFKRLLVGVVRATMRWHVSSLN